MQALADEGSENNETVESLQIDLRNPALAAFLAWLLPGAGHLYQKRTAKGILFMVCILGTFLFGLYLGAGRVVYASLRGEDRRLPYLCQIGVGLPALPALVQAYRMHDPRFPKSPLAGGLMAPPRLPGQKVPRGSIPDEFAGHWPNSDAYVVNHRDELHEWQSELHGYFELGTVYTMIAGLLNVLAIYDAWGGPLLVHPGKREPPTDDDPESS